MNNTGDFDRQNRIRIGRQLKLFRRALVVILFFVVLLALLTVKGRMNDVVRGTGTVLGIREYQLKSLVAAKTVEIRRHEGDFVKHGEPLIVFDMRRQQDQILELENRVKELQISLRAKTSALQLLKIDPLPPEYRYAKPALQEAADHFRYAEEEKGVYDKLDAGNKSRLNELQILYKYSTAKMNFARRPIDADKIADGTMRREILTKGETELDLLRQQLRTAEDRLAIAKRNLEDYILTAPDDGILTEAPPRPGNYYEKGEVIVHFAANQNKRVVALVNEKQVYKIQPGQLVRITSNQYNYLDYGYFPGVVDYVYQLPVETGGERCYPVKVLLKKEPYPLRFGSSCEVSIITGRERILFSLLNLKSEDYANRRIDAASIRRFEKAFLDAEEKLREEQKRQKTTEAVPETPGSPTPASPVRRP